MIQGSLDSIGSCLCSKQKKQSLPICVYLRETLILPHSCQFVVPLNLSPPNFRFQVF